LLNSSDTVVVLKTADLEASGIYRCEVSGEAPSFRTVVESSQMVVVGKLGLGLRRLGVHELK
jgi:hypothetical protein